MDTEQTFTVGQLLDFVAMGEYYASVLEATQFVVEFLKDRDIELSDYERESIVRRYLYGDTK